MIKVKNIKQTCYACPSQWEGKTDNGERVYVRYRWGNLSIDINGNGFYSESIGDGLAGVLGYDELKEYTKHLIEWPEHSEDKDT